MKKLIVAMSICTMAFPLFAQQTNQVDAPKPPEMKDDSVNPRDGESRRHTPEERKAFRERHLKLMEKMLNEIGVTDEQREQIVKLQDAHRQKMKENWKRLNEARCSLSKLQDDGASEEEIDAAIQEIADAQAEQLKILVRNRREMEKILGKEKSDQLMENVRKVYRKHGRRPGKGMPPRPDPMNEGGDEPPPAPPAGERAEEPPPIP